MYQVDIKYKDYFNGNKEAIERLYFNLTAFELAEIAVEFEDRGGIEKYMTDALQSDDYKNAFQGLKMLFVNGYGRRETRGDRIRFIKKPEWLAEILPSPEFEAFYLKLTSDTGFATAFWNNLASHELLEKARQVRETEDIQAKSEVGGKKFRELSLQEQVEELQKKLAAKKPANEAE